MSVIRYARDIASVLAGPPLPRHRIIDTALVGIVAFTLGLASAGHPPLASLVEASSATGAESDATPAERTPDGMTSCGDRIYDRLFFGLGSEDGSVSAAEWRRFMSDVVTPRFPEGLTIVEANGQWRASGERQVTFERSRVVEIAHEDSPVLDHRLREVVAVYKHRYRQRSVMLTRARVEVCW